VGAAIGVFFLALTVTERLARWGYRTVRGAIEYWRDEINDLRTGGVDPEQLEWEKDAFVNGTDEKPNATDENKGTDEIQTP
jgi:hypothetical protein